MYWTIHIDGKLVTVKPSAGVAIPIDEANTDYLAYLAWVAEGNTAEQWTPETEA